MRWLLIVVSLAACSAPRALPPSEAPRPEPAPLELAAVPLPASVADVWRWHCCSGRYTGGLALLQSGNQLRGIFLTDEGMGTYVDGSVDGHQLTFTRRWLNAGRLYSQIYSVRLSPDARQLQGSFTETHAPSPPIDFHAERRYQPELADFNPAAPRPPTPAEFGRLDGQGRLLPTGCDCSRPCGCSGIPGIMECHMSCGCPTCPPGIP